MRVLGERGATIRNMDANTVTSRVTPVRIMNERMNECVNE